MAKATNLGQLEKLAQRIHDRNAALETQLNGVKPAEYSLVKQAAAEEGYLATYCLTKDGAQVGEKINVPKDLLVQSAKIETVHYAGSPYAGAVPGDKFIDFTLASEDERFLGVKWKFFTSAPYSTRIYNIPIADMQPEFRMKIGGVKATIKIQDTPEAEEPVWNEDKTECTLYAASDKLSLGGVQKGSLAYAFNALFKESGMKETCQYDYTAVIKDDDTARIEFVPKDESYPPYISIGDAEHLFVPVKDLVNVYTGGSGVEVAYGAVNAAVDAANANGLGVTADGLQLATATTTAAGVMSAGDKSKLDGTFLATDAEVDTMLNNIFGKPALPDDMVGPGEAEEG